MRGVVGWRGGGAYRLLGLAGTPYSRGRGREREGEKGGGGGEGGGGREGKGGNS